MKISELKKQAPKRKSKNNEKMYLRLRLNIQLIFKKTGL
jgi:hypothetical protein